MVPNSFLVFLSNQLRTLGFYIFNVVKLMFIAFFLFHVCYHDGV